MTTLYLVRHGETVDNKAQIMQGQTPGQLNDTGRRQACAVRDRMRLVPIDVFVASDLRRAVETCELIAAPHGLPVVTTSLLRERDWGGFTGKFIPDLKNQPWPDDVESLEHMKKRAQAFIDWIRSNFAGQTVLAVGHGIINKAVQSVYFDKPMNEVAKMSNAEVRLLYL